MSALASIRLSRSGLSLCRFRQPSCRCQFVGEKKEGAESLQLRPSSTPFLSLSVCSVPFRSSSLTPWIATTLSTVCATIAAFIARTQHDSLATIHANLLYTFTLDLMIEVDHIGIIRVIPMSKIVVVKHVAPISEREEC